MGLFWPFFYSLPYLQKEWQLTHEQVVEYKEVFMLFDKDEDGVLSFPELAVVMKSLGQRPSGMAFTSKMRNFAFSHLKNTFTISRSKVLKNLVNLGLFQRTFWPFLAFLLLSEDELLKMVQEVSEDPVYHTIEFNEFLQLLSKQQRSGTTRDSLTDAFR